MNTDKHGWGKEFNNATKREGSRTLHDLSEIRGALEYREASWMRLPPAALREGTATKKS
jgi:hypothetical protein